MSYLVRGVAAKGEIRVIGANTTELVKEACTRHEVSLTAGAALGRTLTGTLLLCHVLLKNLQDRVTVRLRADGPLGGVIADGGLDGAVRGYVKNPGVELDTREDGKLNVGGAVGKNGEIEVIRSHAPYGDPYSSSVTLASGEIAEDITKFLAVSEQLFSVVLLGVRFERGRVVQSGGILFQALPGATNQTLEHIEDNVRSFDQLTDAMRTRSLIEILNELTSGLHLEILNDRVFPLQFRCRCSDEKARDAVAYFPPKERERMVDEDGGAEVVCHWCGEVRWLTSNIIRSLGGGETRCPECGALWYRDGRSKMIRAHEICACGRKVILPS
jgi:molecular chaperone Hsp33